MTAAERNVLLLTVIRATAVTGAVTIPILATLLPTYGTSLWETDWYFTSAMLCSYVPSGLLAERLGRTRVIRAGAALLITGTVVYLLASRARHCFAAEILLGIGQGFILGKEEALLHGSLEVSGRVAAFSSRWKWVVVGEAAASGLSFYLGQRWSLACPRLAFVWTLACFSLLFACSLMLREMSPSAGRGISARELLASFKSVLSGRNALLQLIMGYTVLTACFRLATWGYPGYLAVTTSQAQYGYLLVCFCAVFAVSALAAGRIRHVSPAIMSGFIVLTGVSFLALGLLAGKWSFLFAFAHPVIRGLSRGPLTAAFQAEVSMTMPHLRASAASLRETIYMVVYLSLLYAAQITSTQFGILAMFTVFGAVLLLGTLFTSILRRGHARL